MSRSLAMDMSLLDLRYWQEEDYWVLLQSFLWTVSVFISVVASWVYFEKAQVKNNATS